MSEPTQFQQDLALRFKDKYNFVFNNHVLIIDVKETFDVMRALKDEFGFNMLLDVCGGDNLKRPKSEWTHGVRFESV